MGWQQYWPVEKSGTGGGSGSFDTLGELLGLAINIMMGVGFAAGFMALAVGLIQLVTSAGEPKATEKGINTVKWALAGIFIAIMILVLKSLLLDLLEVTDPNVTQPVPNL